jgi:N-acetyl-gamma-glutamyl-phosphate reductase
MLPAHFAGQRLVRRPPRSRAARIEAEDVNDTDLLELRVFGNEKHRHAALVARLDNLGKGASGAAVQSIGLMLGLGAFRHRAGTGHA